MSTRLLNRQGYVSVWIPIDDEMSVMRDKEGRVLEHRLVYARHLGRPLYEFEYIHHKNGIKTDNRIENLELVTPQEHVEKHPGMPELIKGKRPIQQVLFRWDEAEAWTASAVLAELQRRRVSIRVEGDDLLLKPKCALNNELLARVLEAKPAILEALQNRVSKWKREEWCDEKPRAAWWDGQQWDRELGRELEKFVETQRAFWKLRGKHNARR